MSAPPQQPPEASVQPQEPPPSDPSKDAPPKPKEVELVDCFEGLEQQVRPQDVAAEVLSGRVFLRQFESTDPVFRMMVKDSTNEVFTKNSPEQSLKNWQILSLVFDDFGFEVSDEVTFLILSGEKTAAVQLAKEIRQLKDPQCEHIVMRRTGPGAPLRQRINPFLGVAVDAKGEELRSTVAASTIVPTRIFVNDSHRFMRKRTHFVEQCEKLREKEIKAQKQREKKEREAAKAAADAQRRNELAAQQQIQEQFIKESVFVSRADPEKLAERQQRTALLNELEVLESAFSADEKKILKLKHRAGTPPAKSPPRSRKVKSPQRIRAVGSIPYSKTPSTIGKKYKDEKVWRN